MFVRGLAVRRGSRYVFSMTSTNCHRSIHVYQHHLSPSLLPDKHAISLLPDKHAVRMHDFMPR